MKHPGMINVINDYDSSNFEWSENNFNKIKKIINKYPQGKQQSAVLPVLDIAQRQNKGWLSKKAIEKVAETLSMSFIRVMEIATFYSMFNLLPVGKYYHANIQVFPRHRPEGLDRVHGSAVTLETYHFSFRTCDCSAD